MPVNPNVTIEYEATVEDERGDSYYEISADILKCCFMYKKRKMGVGRTQKGSSGYALMQKDHNKWSSMGEQISVGYITVSEVAEVSYYDESQRLTFTLMFFRDGICTGQEIVDFGLLRNDPKTLENIAKTHNVVFIKSGKIKLVADYLINYSARQAKCVKRFYGFCFNHNGAFIYPGIKELAGSEASDEELLEFLWGETPEVPHIPGQVLFLLLYRLLSEMISSGVIERLPVVIAEAPTASDAAKHIADVLGEKTVFTIDSGTKEHTVEKVRVLDAAASTDYNIRNYMRGVIAHAVRHPVIIVTDKLKRIADHIEEDYSVILPYEGKYLPCEEAHRLYIAMLRIFNMTQKLKEGWHEELKKVDATDFPEGIRRFTADMIIAAKFIVKMLTKDGEKSAAYGSSFQAVLSEYMADNTERMLIRLKELLRTGDARYAPDKSGNINISGSCLSDCASAHGWTPMYMSKLRRVGVINDESLKNVTVNGVSYKGYTINFKKLFKDGELRAVYNEYAKKTRPGVMIPFAECCGFTVYFALKDRSGADNANILITGPSGSGKSAAVTRLASEAAKVDIPVMIPVLDGDGREYIKDAAHYLFENGKFVRINDPSDVAEFKNEDTGSEIMLFEPRIIYIHFPDAAEQSALRSMQNRFLNKVFAEKKKRSDLVMLQIDEAQEWDMQPGSSLVNIIRQGRKHGFITCLVTQSVSRDMCSDVDNFVDQFDTLVDFGKNRHSRVELNKFGFEDHERMMDVMKDRPEYGCLAVGHLSTATCGLRYPVLLTFPEKASDENVIEV